MAPVHAVYGTNPIRACAMGAGPTNVMVGVIKGVDSAIFGAPRHTENAHRHVSIGTTQRVVVQMYILQLGVALQKIHRKARQGVVAQAQLS